MMSTASAWIDSRAGVFAATAAALVALAGPGLARAESMPDSDNGRYTLAPIDGGVMRLDTRSGAISNCSNSGLGWACYVVPDERAALDQEIGRLQLENQQLRTQLAEREPTVPGKTDEALPKSDSLKPAEPPPRSERKLEIPLPSDRDLDRMMGFLERAWRHLVDMANRIQNDPHGKI